MNQAQFLYPSVQQFSFDLTCERIVRELEKRNWQVSGTGINVEFDEYGSGEQKFRRVSHIKGRDFKLWFCRVQRTIPGGHWNDTAAVTQIVIPKKEIHVYKDESGPTFYLYVGKDWEQDREQFMNGSKVNSKLNGKPKMYLRYNGECHCDKTKHTHSRRRSPLLVHTNDLNREYDPEGDEPKIFFTTDIIGEFADYLKNVVLNSIISQPIPAEKVDMFVAPKSIPFPESIGSLFCFGRYDDAERIKQGKMDSGELDPSDRYGLSGGGRRLMSLNTPNDGTVPKIAYEGFLWCGIGEVTSETEIDSLEVPGHYQSEREKFIIRVKPNQANEIYIADQAQWEKRRKELGDAMEEERDRFTDDEVADFIRTRARTIIPISEYRGGYEQPVVLIKRELSFDEVEVIVGPKDQY